MRMCEWNLHTSSLLPLYSRIIVYSTQALPDPYPQISISLSTAAWHADNRAVFPSTPLSDRFEDVAANPRLVLTLSHCLSSLSIWPAVGLKSAVPFSRASGCSVVSTVYMLENPSFYFLITCSPPTSRSDLVFGQERLGNLQWHLAGRSCGWTGFLPVHV